VNLICKLYGPKCNTKAGVKRFNSYGVFRYKVGRCSPGTIQRAFCDI